jgi:CheY-like chemotaxis protein
VTTPTLEKPDLLKDDPLASTVNTRQRYDWRAQADLPITDPATKKYVRELAEKIAQAISRTKLSMPTIHRRLVGDPEFETASQAIQIERAATETTKEIQYKRILWVDDRPDNNITERRAMEAYNIKFELALSTSEALTKLRNNHFDAIISDMGRPPDQRAGYTLLDTLRKSGVSTPYFIYAGSDAPRHLSEALSHGAQGSTNRASALITDVLKSLGYSDSQIA